MNEADYYLDLYRQRSKRIRYVALLLVTIFSLMLVDFFVHQWKFKDYYSKLPMLLYDFSQKYNKPLTEWWRGYKEKSKSPTLRSSDPGAIPFQNSDPSDTEKGVNWGRIPLLHEYLVPHRPSASDARKFLGWELPTPLYLVVALCIPSALLLWLLIDAYFLRRASVLLREGTASKTTTLILQSIFIDRIGVEGYSFRRLRAAAVAVSLFALASVSAALVIYAPTHGYRIVEGTLYLTPSQFPDVSSASVPNPRPPKFWEYFWLITVAVNAALCALIGREVAKIKA